MLAYHASGDIVENFTLPDQDGNTINLTDFCGQAGGAVLLPEGGHAGMHD